MTEPIPAGTVDPAKLEIHPAAGVFPLVEDAEFAALVQDIRKNGLRNPIVLDAEARVLLDGRRRQRACAKAGVEPSFVRYVGEDSPVDLIISLNVQRRHMNESQRALVAARLVPQLKGYERAETSLNLGRFGRAARAGALLNVSKGSVELALRVLKSGNIELIQAVDSGKLKVSTAARKLRPPAPESKPVPPLAAGESAVLLWGPAAQITGALGVLQGLGIRYRRLDTLSGG